MLVSNIPRELRSADLRFFFNEWVEGDRFRCFHYQHRADASSRGRGEQRCCLVRLKDKDVGAFTSKYHGQRWLRARPVCAPCAALVRAHVPPRGFACRDNIRYVNMRMHTCARPGIVCVHANARTLRAP